MAADSGSDADEQDGIDRRDPELANGDSVSERLDEIEFEESEGHSVAEMREKLDADS
ncbi:hypothetical protein [Halorussus salinus]|uniref:hypothetical protein n=1 Tax=Halorussus salinus TaxID=1364935 RepID=UPI00138F11F1|nr:hypothetical protein [Halorussus salinus]